MTHLEDNPPVRAQYRVKRRAPERGVIVVHTAENTPDLVAFDGGAEAVARFIQTRTTVGSYHELVDSDSRISMVRDTAEAYGDGTGSNAWAWHLSVATRADVWPLAPQAWRNGAVEQAAQAAAGYAHRLHARTGIVIPARRISRTQSETGVPGFISHGDRDPGRRHDPGAAFPWEQFLARYAQLTADLNGATPAPPEEDDMPAPLEYWRHDGDFRIYKVPFGNPGKIPMFDEDARQAEAYMLALKGHDTTVHVATDPKVQKWLEQLPLLVG